MHPTNPQATRLLLLTDQEFELVRQAVLEGLDIRSLASDPVAQAVAAKILTPYQIEDWPRRKPGPRALGQVEDPNDDSESTTRKEKVPGA